MGSTISAISSTISPPVATLQWLHSESTKILNTATSIISLTSAAVMSYVGNLADRAESQIAIVFKDIDELLSELTIHGDHAQQCIDAKKPEINKIRKELVSSLVECYKSHGEMFTRSQQQRNTLKNKAIILKSDAEAMIASCTRQNEPRFTCLAKNLSQLSKRSKALVYKVETHAKKEFSGREKNILQIMSCDRKVIRRAYGAVDVIIKDIKQCILNAESITVMPNNPE